jgi:hypothetical protein
MNAVEAQDVGSERAQTGKDARIAADAAGVLCEATVTDVVRAILDVPVATDGFGTLGGWQRDTADKQGGLACSATIWMGSRIASFSNVAGSTPIASSRCSRCIILFGS